MSLTINLIPDLETQVRQDAKREGLAPEAYVNRLLSRYLQRKKFFVSHEEATLLQQINAGLPEKTWLRLELLRSKLQEDSLTVEEQQELINISDIVEEANVTRLQALIQLAELRNSTVDRLIDELGIRPPTYV